MILILLLGPLAAAQSWAGWGGGPLNDRWARTNTLVTSTSIVNLTHHCTASHPIGVSATPVLQGNTAYYPTWAGTFAALDFTTCQLLWETNLTAIITAYAPLTAGQIQLTKAISRTSPQADPITNTIFLGTQSHALVLALNLTTGAHIGTVQLNPHPYAVITQSPTLYNGTLFIGSSSVEHLAARDPDYKCCSVTGVFAALRFDPANRNFTTVWYATTIPEVHRAAGWAGVSVWGSQPSISVVYNTVFIGTGNSYSLPSDTITCQERNNATAFLLSGDTDPCLPEDVLQDSIVALDIHSGDIKWAFQTPGVDAYLAGCGYPGLAERDARLCPQVPGPDADFGMAPALVAERNMLLAGRKNGVVYALSARDGRVLWKTSAAPGGIGGGVSWGVAVDAERVYYGSVNTGYLGWKLKGGETVDRGFYGALDINNGSVVWQTPVPRVGGVVHAPPSVVGDLVLIARTGQDPGGNTTYDLTNGGLVALDKVTGRVVLDYEMPSNVHSGVAIRDRYLLLGTGYSGVGGQSSAPGGFHVLTV